MKMPLNSTKKILQHQIFSGSTLTLTALKYKKTNKLKLEETSEKEQSEN